MKAILKVSIIIAVSLATFLPSFIRAEEFASRQGFFIGFDLGSGLLHMRNKNQGAFLS